MCRTCVRAARRQANRGPADRAGGDQLMTRLRRTGLKIDDPLTPTAANDQMPTAVPGRDEEHAAGPSGGPSGSTQSPKPRPSPAPRARSERALGSGPATSATKKAPTQAATAITTNGAWRAWSGQTRVASYRLPATGRASRRARLYLGGTPAPDWAARHCRHRPPPRRARRRDRRSRRPSRRRSHRGASCRTSLCLRTSPRGSDGASEAAGTL